MNLIKLILDWLSDHTPVSCARCGLWMLSRDAWTAMHKICGNINLCSRCYTELYLLHKEDGK
jgi:hypothetical protein